jgi:hypothetical protein
LVQLPISAEASSRIALLAHVVRHARRGPREVGRVRADDVRLERREIDLDHLVEELRRVRLDLRVGAQQLGVAVGEVGELLAAGRLEIGRHALVVREDRRRSRRARRPCW